MPDRRRKRRRLSMTSLIDVIFLLLLFFMLTSTFSKFAEVDLAAAGAGGTAETDARPLFLQLGRDDLNLNGQPETLATLAAALSAKTAPDTDRQSLLVSLKDGVTAQRLTDLLVALKAVAGLRVTVLGT